MTTPKLRLTSGRFSPADLQLIKAAEIFSERAHLGQKRKSGEPYFIHPLAVAQAVADWGLDAETIAAALLHDTVEDTEVTLEQVEAKFGPKVAELVAGVTKLGEVDFVPADSTRGEASYENVRKLLIAMSKDLRVILIKLGDRRHNLRTLQYLPEEDRVRIAKESLEIFAPLADRLGMGELKAEIEDLSFKYLMPERYSEIESMVRGYLRKSSSYINRLKSFITAELEAAGVEPIEISGRAKHLHSIHKKLLKADHDLTKIYDLMALRIIVPTPADCYKTMGVVHQFFKPLIYRIKDYIAVPKPNGYRSLHTTVFALDGRIIEVQIRTPEMHEEAERGLAAHFFYDQSKQGKAYLAGEATNVPAKLNWVSQLTKLGDRISAQDLMDALEHDLFRDRIFVFSPKGDLFDLPEGSTPIDFGFAVHTQVGLRAQGAQVNSRLAALDTKLQNRDVVEIITKRQAAPSRDWLNFAQTPHARQTIRAWFRAKSRSSNVTSGQAIVEKELRAWSIKKLDEIPSPVWEKALADLNYKDLESLLAAVGEGMVSTQQLMRRLFPDEAVPTKPKPTRRRLTSNAVQIGWSEDLPYKLAACCKPEPPQPIVGYITRGEGVTVHLSNCSNLPPEPHRLIACDWQDGTRHLMPVRLEVIGQNRIGLLRDLTVLISAMGININHLDSYDLSDREKSLIKIDVEVGDNFTLAALINKIEKVRGVTNVDRLQPD